LSVRYTDTEIQRERERERESERKTRKRLRRGVRKGLVFLEQCMIAVHDTLTVGIIEWM
jgi:hypothetical protein